MGINKNGCNNDKRCSKIENCAMELVAYTMKMQCAISKKLEQARCIRMQADELIKKANCMDKQAEVLMREAEELNKQLECELKKANTMMFKAIECYKEKPCECRCKHECCEMNHLEHEVECGCGDYNYQDDCDCYRDKYWHK